MDRRIFLKNTAAGVGVATLGSLLAACDIIDSNSDALDVAGDISILRSAATMEGVAVATYNAAASLLSPGTLAVAVRYRDHHIEHAIELNKVISKLGGTPINISGSSFDPRAGSVTTENQVLELAVILEFEASTAYFNHLLSGLVSVDAKRIMANIFPIEVSHFSFLKSALGGNSADYYDIFQNIPTT